jgi:acyl-CoA synthetase (AMP-forming)/AMP-acid ligase II
MTLEIPFRPIGALVAAHGHARSDAPAVTVGETTLSWRDLANRAGRVAASLQREGLKPADAIAIVSGTSTDYVALYMGALMEGVCVAPMPPSATPAQIAAMVADSGAPLLFLDAANAEALADQPIAARRIALEALDSWLADGPPHPLDLADEALLPLPFNIIYSSGTTGVPKGIVHSFRMRWAHLVGGAAAGYGPDAVCLLATPLYSNTTLVSALPCLAWGGHLVLMPKFDARGFLELAQQVRATHSMLVPVQYRRIMELPDFDRFDLSSYRLKFCTSAPFAAELKADVLKRWPGGLVEYWGMTEGGGGTALVAHNHPDKLHTVGQPLPGAEIRIMREDGSFAGANEVGEIVGFSGATMTGYANRPEATRETQWVAPDGRIFIRTGDLGRLDADGFLELVGRKKDMIISGGFNIYPVDLEEVLAVHPAVVECAVVGVPSPEWGETPVAYAVVREAVDPEALRAFVNGQVGKTQRLAAVRLIDELPRSVIGKVLKRELREMWGA